MNRLSLTYHANLALLTDLYQLTMASAMFSLGRHEQLGVFHLYFRANPFKGGYAIAAGLADVVNYLSTLRFESDDIGYLAKLQGNDEQPLLHRDFLSALRSFRFECDIDAIPEGTAVFPNEPLVRVTGPVWQGMLIETPLLALMNFPTLVATKAARVCQAAHGDKVIEFGLRRAQGIDRALSASRAAMLGGCHGTSNVLAGKMFDVPISGTHAHSWVMSFDSELEAFEAYAKAAPNNTIFLVDTYNTLDGVRHAARVGQQLRAAGHKMIGIRLDSGDLAYLSIEARRILDEAGLHDAAIAATNDLDEQIIESLKQQGAKINLWGVGTKLVTAYDQPSLGGVYKLAATRDNNTLPWKLRAKSSETVAKASIPGILQARRFEHEGQLIADAVWSETIGIDDRPLIIDPTDSTRRKHLQDETSRDLLVPIFRAGALRYDVPSLHATRLHAANELSKLHPTIKRLVNPHVYPVGLEHRLHELRTQMLLKAKGELGAVVSC